MKKTAFFPLLSIFGGVICFVLRTLQNRSGFEADTGLPISGSIYGYLLPATLSILAVAAFLLCLRLPSEKGDSSLPFSAQFRTANPLTLMLVIGGIFLWCLSGIADLLPAFLSRGEWYTGTASGLYYPVSDTTRRVSMILSLLIIPAAVCLFPTAVAARRGEDNRLVGNSLLFPVVYLILRLTVSYREMSINASQQTYYVELLAFILLILSLYRLSSFAFRCGNTRRFVLYTTPAITLCITAITDVSSTGDLLFFCGSTAMLLGFLMMRLTVLHTESAG